MSLTVVIAALAALADEPAEEMVHPTESEIGAPMGPRLDRPEAEARARDVGAGLRCPVCQGMSVADSPSASARQMYGLIVDLTAEGYTADQIRDYFVGRYGEWVLLEPPMQGNWLVWLAPAVALGIGVVGTAATVTRWRREPEPLPSDLGHVPKDRYEERLLAEIDE
jgi:cytochrome c-type biogenesis protein CcmH/NrfF